MIKLYKEQMSFTEAKAVIEADNLALPTLESEEGMGVMVGLLHTNGITSGLVLVHESITEDKSQFSAKVYDIELDEVKDVLVTPELTFYVPYVEVKPNVPICPCGDKELGYEMTVEHQDDSNMIVKAKCKACGNVYGLKYILTEVVQLPRDEGN